MNPEFGSILHELVFDPLDARTEMLARNDVENIINSDPRWIFEDLNLTKPVEHQLDIRIRVIYDDTGTAEELYLTYTSETE